MTCQYYSGHTSWCFRPRYDGFRFCLRHTIWYATRYETYPIVTVERLSRELTA